MNVLVKKSKLNGEISIPSSKSVAHRKFIASALADSPTLVYGKFIGEDLTATLNCLKKMGADFVFFENGIKIYPIKKQNKNVVLNANESGSTLRFLIPIASALGINAKFTGTKRLGERPINDLVNVLNKFNAKIDNDKLPINLGGKLENGEFEIDSSKSSQFITGLLFSLPLLKNDSKLILKNNVVSKNYIDLTISALKEFKIEVKPTKYGYFVKGNQKYISPKKVFVEGDWSNACFFIAGGILSGDIDILNLDFKTEQGDSIILDLIKKANASFKIENNVLKIHKSKILPIEFSAKDCPDIVPVMAVLLSNANGVSKIYDVDRLKIKESDRLNEIILMLKSLKIKASYENNCLIIYGDNLKGGKIVLPNDHRMAMSASIAGLVSDTMLINAECVKKSYPTFFEDLKSIGGNVDVIEY